MGRIPAFELERLKRETDLLALVRTSGIELRRHGSDWRGRCPFHDDRDPSLVITPSKNLWHCLGACDVGGSVIDWVMRRDGVSFRKAADTLMEHEGTAPSLELNPECSDGELLAQVTAFYHETLKSSPEAIAYLESRGLSSVELIDRFRLGLANRTLGYRLPKRARKAGERIRDRLQQVGILRKTGHEHLAGSLVIPVTPVQGENSSGGGGSCLRRSLARINSN